MCIFFGRSADVAEVLFLYISYDLFWNFIYSTLHELIQWSDNEFSKLFKVYLSQKLILKYIECNFFLFFSIF